MTRALFLDRDGVINVDKDYLYRIEDVEFVDGIFDLARAAHEKNYKLIVVTNQSGIGRGYYSEAQFHTLMAWMRERFEKEGSRLTDYFFCPYHPEHGIGEYRRDHENRKPRPGMLLSASTHYGINLLESIMIGDKSVDLQAADAAGIGRAFQIGGTGERGIRNLRDVIPYL